MQAKVEHTIKNFENANNKCFETYLNFKPLNEIIYLSRVGVDYKPKMVVHIFFNV